MDRVEAKQDAVGIRSGTQWEIDGKGFLADGSGFLIVECRRFTASKQNQEKLGALAYRIMDTGARGGIIVSSLGLQEGAMRVANAENIQPFFLSKDSNSEEYVMAWLGNLMGREILKLDIQDSLTIGEVDEAGKFTHIIVKTEV